MYVRAEEAENKIEFTYCRKNLSLYLATSHDQANML
jgi:hypothetical protein